MQTLSPIFKEIKKLESQDGQVMFLIQSEFECKASYPLLLLFLL